MVGYEVGNPERVGLIQKDWLFEVEQKEIV